MSRFAAVTFGLLAAAVAGLAPAWAQTKGRDRATGPVLVKEAASKELCERESNRLFVSSFVGTECIAYYATPTIPGSSVAILYFNGDLSNDDLRDKSVAPDFIASFAASARILAEKAGVQIVFMARPGTFGSSGDHALRGERREMFVMNAAVDALKARLGVSSLIVTGQSRGSQVAASLLTMRRNDIRCAVLGSGVLHAVEFEQRHANARGRELNAENLRTALYDPGAYLSEVVTDPARRILVLGDRSDTITHFDLQERFASKLKALGHHAAVFEIKAQGREMHGATHMVLPAAIMCAKGSSDQEIGWVVRPPEEKPTPRPPATEPSSQVLPRPPLAPSRGPSRNISDGADPMPAPKPRTGGL